MLQYYRREGEPNFAHLFNTPLHYEQGIYGDAANLLI